MDFSSILKILPVLASNNGGNLWETLPSLLGGLGVDSKLISTLINTFNRLISGDIDLNQLITAVIPIATAYLAKNKNAPSEDAFDSFDPSVKLSPLDGFMDGSLFEELDDYLANDTAS